MDFGVFDLKCLLCARIINNVNIRQYEKINSIIFCFGINGNS